MATGQQSGSLRSLSIGSLLLGILGAAFCWWVPYGIILSLAGLVLGLVDGLAARRRSLDARLALVAILISLATLCLGLVVAAFGLQTVTFGYR